MQNFKFRMFEVSCVCWRRWWNCLEKRSRRLDLIAATISIFDKIVLEKAGEFVQGTVIPRNGKFQILQNANLIEARLEKKLKQMRWIRCLICFCLNFLILQFFLFQNTHPYPPIRHGDWGSRPGPKKIEKKNFEKKSKTAVWQLKNIFFDVWVQKN